MIYKDKNSILVGLTGGIASGKSTIIEYLNKKGYSTINADKLGHKVLEQESAGYLKVLKTFGNIIGMTFHLSVNDIHRYIYIYI